MAAPGSTSQQWLFFSDGAIRGVDSHLCLDADLSSPQNLQLWSCGGGNNQKWRFVGRADRAARARQWPDRDRRVAQARNR